MTAKRSLPSDPLARDPGFGQPRSGPNGWTNFGSNLNHLCGFFTPVNLGADRAAVLGTIQMLYIGSDTVEFYMSAVKALFD